MTIRLATIDDVPGILAISNHYVLHSAANFAIEPESLAVWRAEFEATHGMYPWFVAAAGAADVHADGATEQFAGSTYPLAPSLGGRGKLMGFAKATPWKGRCAYAYAAEITVYVHPDHHRKGLGRALYGKLLETMTAQGYRTALGGIALPNSASVALHESFGMTCAGVLKRVGWKFGKWHDVGYWQADLQPDPESAPDAIRPVRDVLT